MLQKNSFVITATHPAFGTVTFALDATDAKAAFVVWKQVVGSTKQWIVKRNEEGTACATPAVQQVDENVCTKHEERKPRFDWDDPVLDLSDI
jgi:hypothetical protein